MARYVLSAMSTLIDQQPPGPAEISRALGQLAACGHLTLLRELIPLTRADVAQRVGISECTLALWEAGHLPADPYALKRYCAVLAELCLMRPFDTP